MFSILEKMMGFGVISAYHGLLFPSTVVLPFVFTFFLACLFVAFSAIITILYNSYIEI